MAEISTVYVTAWAYHGGGGFDWYETAQAADQAFAAESQNVIERSSDGWTAFRFDLKTEAGSAHDITREIADCLINLCRTAERSIGPLIL